MAHTISLSTVMVQPYNKRSHRPRAVIVLSDVDLEFSCLGREAHIGVRERDDIEVVAARLLQLVVEARLKVDFGGVFLLGLLPVAEVKQNATSVNQDDLLGIPLPTG